MREVSPDELKDLAKPKGRRVSPLGALIRELEIGKSVLVDTEVDEIKNPLSAYHIAKSIGRKVKLNKRDETSWVVTRIE